MKYLFMYVLLICCMTAGAQQTAGKPFTLTGEITGAKEGVLFFSYAAGDKRVTDSAVIRNGRFRFTGTVTEPVMAYMSYGTKRPAMDDPNVVTFFIEPANMKMTMALTAFKDAVITGSTTQNEYDLLQKQQQKLRNRWQIVMDTLSAINKRSNALFQETKAWALSPYNEEHREITASFILKHPSSYVTAWLLQFSRDISTDSLKKLYARFPDRVKQSAYGKAIITDLEKRKTGIPGAKAAVFSSAGIDGQQVSLADYKGKYVLIDFWASWCVPCRKLNPHLKELYARYKDKGFEVIGVSDDDSKPEAWKKAVEQDGLPWKQVLRGMKMIRNGDNLTIDRSKDISDGYNIHSLPTQVLIDPNGMIIGRYGDELGEDHAALDKKLEEIFNAQSTKEKILFKGTADAKYNGNMIVLYNRSTNDMDSAIIQNGRFEISVPFKEPSRYMLYSKYEQKNKGGYAPWGIVVTGPGTVEIKAKVDSLSASIVSGAPENDLYDQYIAVSMAAQKKIMDQLYATYGKAFLDTLTPKNPKYKDIAAEFQGLQAANQPAELERLEQFISKHPASFAALYVLSGSSNSLEAGKLEALYNTLTPAWKGSSQAKKLAMKLDAAKALAIGKVAPDFTQPDTLGHDVSLKDFRGKYVLIDFWASWCGPCRAENPNVVNAFNKYKDKGFTVLGVSLDRQGARDKWIEAIHKDNLTWTHVSDLKSWDNAVAKQYGIQAIPQNFLLDREGRILATNINGDELLKKLEEVFRN